MSKIQLKIRESFDVHQIDVQSRVKCAEFNGVVVKIVSLTVFELRDEMYDLLRWKHLNYGAGFLFKIRYKICNSFEFNQIYTQSRVMCVESDGCVEKTTSQTVF